MLGGGRAGAPKLRGQTRKATRSENERRAGSEKQQQPAVRSKNSTCDRFEALYVWHFLSKLPHLCGICRYVRKAFLLHLFILTFSPMSLWKILWSSFGIRYATAGATSFLVREVARRAGVPLQEFAVICNTLDWSMSCGFVHWHFCWSRFPSGSFVSLLAA